MVTGTGAGLTVEAPPAPRRAGGLRVVPLLLLVLLLALAGWKAVRIGPHAVALLARARELRALAGADPASLLHPERLAWAREQLGATRSDLQVIRAETRFLLPLVERLDWIPRYGGDLAATPALLDLGVELCDAGWWALLGAEPVWDALSRPDQAAGQGAFEAALPALVAAQSRFAQAARAVDRARPALDRVRQLDLSPRLAGYVARAGAYWPVLEGGVLLAQDLPALLGQSHPMQYLLLAQNNQELRPTGGFISGVGLLQISAGRIISTTFQDSYAVDALCALSAHPPAPPPLRDYMWASALVLRDSNWSPDWPSSAATAGSLYRLCSGVDVDGVVAIDLEAVSLLLGALGPLQPEGYPDPVSSETLLQYVNEYWVSPLRSVGMTEREQGEWWQHRKDFMGDLLQAALHKVTSAPQSLELTRLGRSVLQALQERHLLIALDDPALGRGLSAAGWDGVLRPTTGDYLLVVDANIGFRKVNPQVQQSVTYAVDPGAAQATLTIRYYNGSQGSTECVAGSYWEDWLTEMRQGCYWDYVRVYVPPGSRLVALQGGDSAAQVSAEAGKAVFSTLLVVAPGQARELVLRYELPGSLAGMPDAGGAEAPYSLLLQKQAGTVAVPYRVSLAGQGRRFSPARSTAVESDGGQEVSFALGTDTTLVWTAAGGSGRATVPMLILLVLGLLLMGCGLWLRRTSRV